MAGNTNTAASQLSRTYDSTQPTVTSVDVPPSSTYGDENNLDFVVNFSENITVTDLFGNPLAQVLTVAIVETDKANPAMISVVASVSANTIAMMFSEVVDGDNAQDGCNTVLTVSDIEYYDNNATGAGGTGFIASLTDNNACDDYAIVGTPPRYLNRR